MARVESDDDFALLVYFMLYLFPIARPGETGEINEALLRATK